MLIGATGGIEDPAERRARAAADEVLAQRIEHEGVDAFVERWLAMPMWAGLPEWAKFSQERRTNTATGLAGSLKAGRNRRSGQPVAPTRRNRHAGAGAGRRTR